MPKCTELNAGQEPNGAGNQSAESQEDLSRNPGLNVGQANWWEGGVGREMNNERGLWLTTSLLRHCDVTHREAASQGDGGIQGDQWLGTTAGWSRDVARAGWGRAGDAD